MGEIITGKRRSLVLTIQKIKDGISEPGYPRRYDGKNSFTWIGEVFSNISEYELSSMPESEYLYRLNCFLLYVQSIESFNNNDVTNEPYDENGTSCPMSYEVTFEIFKIDNLASGYLTDINKTASQIIPKTGLYNDVTWVEVVVTNDTLFLGWSIEPNDNNIISTNERFTYAFQQSAKFYAIISKNLIQTKQFCYFSPTISENEICLSCNETIVVYFNKIDYENNGIENVTWYSNEEQTILAPNGYYIDLDDVNKTVYQLINGIPTIYGLCENNVLLKDILNCIPEPSLTPGYQSVMFVLGTDYDNVQRMYSNNETSWTRTDIGYATNSVRSIIHKNDVWLLGGYLPDSGWTSQDTMMYSLDGENWTGMGLGTTLSSQVNGIAYGNGTWVAVGASNTGGENRTIVYSTVSQPMSWSDWTFASFTGFSGSYKGYDVVFDNGIFIALGDPGTHCIATSSDGINWTGRVTTSIFPYFGTDAAYGNGRWVATGTDTRQLAYSDDNGVTWSSGTTSIFSSAYGIAYGNNIFVAVGAGTNRIAWSSDGVNWNGLGANYFGTGWDIIFYNGYFYAGGSSGGTGSFYKSSDGVNWTSMFSSPYPTINAIGTY